MEWTKTLHGHEHVISLPQGFCLLEKRIVDMTIRSGFTEQQYHGGNQHLKSNHTLKTNWDVQFTSYYLMLLKLHLTTRMYRKQYWSFYEISYV